MFLLPYKTASKSAKTMRDYLGVPMIDPQGYETHTYVSPIINWGNGWLSRSNIAGMFPNGFIVNPVKAIARAVDKVKTLSSLAEKGVNTPIWTRNKEVAESWPQFGAIVLCRTNGGRDGQGITVHMPDDELPLPNADFYSVYTECEKEFRVHMTTLMDGNDVSLVVERKPKRSARHEHPIIRTGEDWYMAANTLSSANLTKIKGVAYDALDAIGLDFGAVDIGMSGGNFVVFEVNTAPSDLGPKTLRTYKNIFKAFEDNYNGGGL